MSSNLSTSSCLMNSPRSLRSNSSSTRSSMLGAAKIWATPSAIAVFPTPGSPMRQGLFFLRRTSVRSAALTSSSRPWTGSSSPRMAISVRSVPTSLNVGVDDAPSPLPVTSCGPSSPLDPAASGYLISMTNRRQNSAALKVELSTPSMRRNTASAPLANPRSSTMASTSSGTLPWAASNPNSANSTCSALTVGESNESAICPAWVNTRFSGGANGNSTSLAFLFIFNNCGDIVNIFPFLPFSSPSTSSSPISSSRNMCSTVSLAFLNVIPYCFNVLLARSGRSMMPMVMTSHPTLGWARRADSPWAVTSEPMHSSDIRSKIMEREDDEVVRR
mmetsp:Transcript_18972/g.41121  ORF Transcript_18972/g.41121 Transcript_18972/m.41121 type:complete len:332 (+) Transcript_18972:307-1302(+)